MNQIIYDNKSYTIYQQLNIMMVAKPFHNDKR